MARASRGKQERIRKGEGELESGGKGIRLNGDGVEGSLEAGGMCWCTDLLAAPGFFIGIMPSAVGSLMIQTYSGSP